MIRYTEVIRGEKASLSEEMEIGSLPARRPNVLRVVTISDTHNLHDSLVLPEADVLIHCGDFTNLSMPWEISRFNSWLGKQKHIPHRVVIAGNHDRWVDLVVRPMITNARFLRDTSCIIEGVTIHGSRFSPSKFLPTMGMSDRVAKRTWDVPRCDILITHQPPGSTAYNFPRGNMGLGAHLQAPDPPILHLFGHVHEYYGVYPPESGHPPTTFICAASRRGKSSRLRPAIVVDLHKPIEDPRIEG